MRIYLEEQLSKIEQEMIEHFEEHDVQYDKIYLTEKDYFPKIEEIEYYELFAKYFYYFQGQYHKLLEILNFINN